MEITQYNIILVNLDPTIGGEIRKTRPCVIISPDELNDNLRTIVVAPMTSKSLDYPTRLKVKHIKHSGWVVIDQIRTIDKKRIAKLLGKLTPKEIEGCKDIIRETFID